jgi:predicted transcriptional regulator
MSIRGELRRILTIISDLTDTNTTVKDTRIIIEANHPFEEIEQDTHELHSLGLIK